MPSFQFRKIEKIADQIDETGSVVAHAIEPIFLFFLEGSEQPISHHLGYSHNIGKGGSEIVCDHGREIRLELAGFLKTQRLPLSFLVKL